MNNPRSYVPRPAARPTTALGNSRHAESELWAMKKTVLLIDVNSATRESRSKAMRTLGATVHCASCANDARHRLENTSYNLVLVDLGSDREGARSLGDEIRANNSRQLVAFLVGSPLFVATSLAEEMGPELKPVAGNSEPVRKPSAFDFGHKIKEAESKKMP